MNRMGRDQQLVTGTGADQRLLGNNVNRRAVILCPPAPNNSGNVSDGTLVNNADTSTATVKAAYTVPAGVQATLQSATAFSTAVAGVVSKLRLTRAGVTVGLGSVTTSGIVALGIALLAGDLVEWIVTTTQPASTTDYTIDVVRERATPRYSVSLSGPAVLDQGITVSAGGLPFVIRAQDFG